MKIAVISDIHGNMPALETVTADIDSWRPDAVVVNGDVVSRGPLSHDCLVWVLERQQSDSWHMVRGNHEDYVLECAEPGSPYAGPAFEIRQFAQFAYEQIVDFVPLLAGWPKYFSICAPDGSELRIAHGSMRDNRDGIYPNTRDAELREQIAPAPKLFVTGHTHRPLTREIDATQVVNIGSVGAPFDADRRLSYGRFTWTKKEGWSSRIVRLDYDFEQIERDYLTSGFLEEAGPLAQLMLVELRRAGGLVYRWASRYQDAVLAAKIGLEESVRLVMADEDLRPFLGPPGWTVD